MRRSFGTTAFGAYAFFWLGVAFTWMIGSAASVLNAQFGRVFLPVGKPFGIFKK